MDDDLELVVGEPEEDVRLDQLQALVRERGGIDRDLRPHAPRRVSERLLDRDVRELLAAPAVERTARRGEDERVDAVRRSALEALEGRRVLGIDREQEASPTLLRRERQVARRDEALLVRERERHASLERPERRTDSRKADDGVQDDVGLGALEELGQVAACLDVLDAVSRSELLEAARAGREGAELEFLGGLDHGDCLRADGAGGS